MQAESRRSNHVYKHLGSRGVTALLIYVDDIIATSNNEKEKSVLKHYLPREL